MVELEAQDHSTDRIGTTPDLLARALDLLGKSSDGALVVLIGGCSRSGKSWLSRTLAAYLRAAGAPSLTVGLDSWLLDVRQRQQGSRVMDRYDYHRIERDISLLLQGCPVSTPVYDPRTRHRISEASSTQLHFTGGALIVEGVIALALESLRRLSELKIFVKVDDALRWQRLMAFYCEFKGLTAQQAESILLERESEEVPFILDTCRWADWILSSGGTKR